MTHDTPVSDPALMVSLTHDQLITIVDAQIMSGVDHKLMDCNQSESAMCRCVFFDRETDDDRFHSHCFVLNDRVSVRICGSG